MYEKQSVALVICFIILYTLVGSILVVKLYFLRKKLIYIEQELKNIYNNTQSFINFLETGITLGNYIIELEKEVYKLGKNRLVAGLSMLLIKIINGKWGVKWWGQILVKNILKAIRL